MFDEAINFLERNPSIIITTHEWPDPDGLGAEIAFSQICREKGVKCRIINSRPIPEQFLFMDKRREVEAWNLSEYRANEFAQTDEPALVILDSSDELNIGAMEDFVPLAKEIFIIDHHDHIPTTGLNSIIDSTASSTCELIAELSEAAGIKLDAVSSAALYAGICYDTGSFAFPKTTARTFRVASGLAENGANPYETYHELNETVKISALLLSHRVFSSLKLLNKNRVAVQILRKEDLQSAHAHIEDAEAFINIPMKAAEIMVSVLIKETEDGLIKCSLRSKGNINVSMIARSFGGGGHVTASGFRSPLGIEETLDRVLEKINATLDEI